MDDGKRVLIFSDAGGTGRSYHADLSATSLAAPRFIAGAALWVATREDEPARPAE